MDLNERNVEELSLTEQVKVLIDDLPAPLQNFLRSDERNRISLQLTTKYNLHADQGGAFERAYLYMLLGVYTPDDFVRELKEAGIPDESIRGLTTDINELVFKRLQNLERQAPPPPTPQPGAPAPFVAPPVPRPVPPPAPSPVPHPAPVVPPAATPIPPSVVAAPAPFAPPPVSVPPQPVAPQPQVRTMAHDMQEAKEHPQAPHPFQPVSPARTFQTASIPTTNSTQPALTSVQQPPVQRPVPPPPANLPGQTPIYSAPQPSKPISPPIPSAPPAAVVNQAPIVKQYTLDPYREAPE